MGISSTNELLLPLCESRKDKRYLFEGFADSVYIDHHFGTDLTVKFQINNLVFAVKL